MNLLTTITRLTRRAKPAPIRALTIDEMRFSVGGGPALVGCITFNKLVELMEKNHISYQPGIAQFVVDIEMEVRSCMALEQEKTNQTDLSRPEHDGE